MKNSLLLVFVCFFSLQSYAGDYVVILHGFGQSSKSMQRLETYLTDSGYEVINISYPSSKYSIPKLAKDFVWQEVIKKRTDKRRKIHFIGYSMGGVVARYIIEHIKPVNFGKLVLIASPVGGSEIANLIRDFSFTRKFFGPAVEDLATDSDVIKRLKSRVNYDVGVISGNISLNFITSFFLISGESDGTVSLESTKVSGMKDHQIMPYPHFMMIRNSKVPKFLVNFLSCSKFSGCGFEENIYSVNSAPVREVSKNSLN